MVSALHDPHNQAIQPFNLNWTKITQPKMLRRCIQSFGTIDWRIDWREGRDSSRNQTVRSQPMKLADSVMRRQVKTPCGSDLLIAIFDDPDNRGQETAPTMLLHPSLWERSPDRDFPPDIAVGRPLPQETAPTRRPLLQRRWLRDAAMGASMACASEALPIIVDSTV